MSTILLYLGEQINVIYRVGFDKIYAPSEPPTFSEEPIDFGSGADDEDDGSDRIMLQDVEPPPDDSSAIVLEVEDDSDSIIDDVGISAKGESTTEQEPPTHIPLFSDLTTQEFIDVALMLLRRVAKPGEVIVQQGDPGDSMFIISTGEVRASIDNQGQQIPVATTQRR